MSVISTARVWADMVKLSHSVFALPFALLATFLAAAPQTPHWRQVGLIVLCMVAARSAAMTFNRVVDAEIDARNPRTAGRPIPRGAISAGTAWLFFAAASVLFLAACAGFWVLEGNRWPVLLGLPVLAWLCGYSLTKRFTRWSHLVLGVALALSPVAAWLAIQPDTLGAAAAWLFVAVATWVAGFDIIYACQDYAFDRSAGLHSVPAAFGIGGALWLARGLHVVTVAALLALGQVSGRGALYYTGVAAVVVLLVVEHALVSPRDLSRVNLAFFTINGCVSLLLGALGCADVLLA